MKAQEEEKYEQELRDAEEFQQLSDIQKAAELMTKKEQKALNSRTGFGYNQCMSSYNTKTYFANQERAVLAKPGRQQRKLDN